MSISACSVKKRTHRKGYYVDWVFSKKEAKPSLTSIDRSKERKLMHENSDQNNSETKVLASNNDELTIENLDTKKGLLLLNDTCGDLILFKSGDIVTARVMEITEDKIKYKRCDNLGGPLFVVSKSTVQSIKYVNGTTEVIIPPTINPYTPSDPGSQQSEYKGPQKMNPKAILSVLAFIAGIFTVGIGFIISLLLANKAVKEITAEPKKWRGLKLAKFMKQLCIVLFVAIAVVIVLAILSGL